MCNSSQEGKDWTKRYVTKYVKDVQTPRFLDIGTGQGTYFNLLSKQFPDSHWTGVEAYKPYITSNKLEEKYHIMLNADARELYSMDRDLSELKYHVVFCGDVLEHMSKDAALALVKKLTTVCGILIIAIPIVKWPQHGDANPFQKHVKDDWSHQEVTESFSNIIDFYKGQKIGVYVVAGTRYTGDRQR